MKITNPGIPGVLAAAFLGLGCSSPPKPVVDETVNPITLRLVLSIKPGVQLDHGKIVRYLDHVYRVYVGTYGTPGQPPNVRSVTIWPGPVPVELLSPDRRTGDPAKLAGVTRPNGEVHLAAGVEGARPLAAWLHEIRHVDRGDYDHDWSGWSDLDRLGEDLARGAF